MKNEDVIIICHDEKAQTWDALDLSLMRQGENFLDCIIDYSDYERYNDTDIANLTAKIYKNWDNIKRKIEFVIKKDLFEVAIHMKGFTMIIEEYTPKRR